jgi:hypothetical protein
LPQPQLSTLVDPLTRLPLEIASHVFTLCLPEASGHWGRVPAASLAPVLLSSSHLRHFVTSLISLIFMKLRHFDRIW